MDLQVTDMRSKFQDQTNTEELLEAHKKFDKEKYLDLFLDQWHHFTPFFVLKYGMMRHEDNNHMFILVLRMPHKYKRA